MAQIRQTRASSSRSCINNLISGIKSWAEFKSKVASFTTVDKGAAFERLVQLRLQLDPVYRTKLAHVWTLKDVPDADANYLRLPAADKGIDLVAKAFDGTYWAIQCKYREDEKASVTWEELSTFVGLTFGVCRNISFGLICTSTDHLTAVLRDQKNIGFLAADAWRELDEEFFEAAFSKKAIVRKPNSPRPHQARAILNGLRHFNEEGNSRRKLIAPCGSGKSLTAYWLAEKMESKLSIVALPSLALVKQTLKVWLQESVANEKGIDWLCVCSDTSIIESSPDDLIAHPYDLGIPCTTDEQNIFDWLITNNQGHRVVFTTYQSSLVVSNAARKAQVIFDLGVFDEAHKTAGQGEQLFAHMLYEKNIRIKRRMFMTATERRYRGVSDTILSMENASIYGETFDLLTFKEALESDPPILCDYQVLVLRVDDKEVQNLIERNAIVRPENDEWSNISSRTLANIIGLRKAINISNGGINHAVSFHSSIARAREFALLQDVFSSSVTEFGNLHTYHVTGAMNTSSRDRILTEFVANKPSLVTNARCLTEGVDIPEIDCVLFADPKNSTVDIVQAAGRAMRRYEGKKQGFIVVPLFVPEGEDIETIYQSTTFAATMNILRALASQDERIIDYFRVISEGGIPSTQVVRVAVDGVHDPEHVNIDAFVQSLSLECWKKIAKLAWRPFLEARDLVRSLRLTSQKEWIAYCNSGKKPSDIPTSPQYIYKNDGWISLGDWLGTGFVATRQRAYRPFEEARAFVKKLKLETNKEWRNYSASGHKPDDIPAQPDRTYKTEWISWADWLGTKRYTQVLRSFNDARAFVHTLNLKTGKEWRAYCKSREKPGDIPANPEKSYKNDGWISWGDWLGTGFIATRHRNFRTFEKAREFVRELKLKSQREWTDYCKSGKKPDDIPNQPNDVYKNDGWISLGDWLGTGNVAMRNRTYRSFEEARAFVHELKLKSWKDWTDYCNSGRMPDDIPKAPHFKYKDDGWISFGDWLGTGYIAGQNRKYLPFGQAREFVHELKLKSGSEWRDYCKSGRIPDDIPRNPHQVYKSNGWSSMGYWLGTGFIATRQRSYRSFEEARAFVQRTNLKSQLEWNQYCKSGNKPEDIPIHPDRVYKYDGWISFGDWLGTGYIAGKNRNHRSLNEARKFVRKLKLNTYKEWRDYCMSGQKPDDIPGSPHKIYKDSGWVSWGDWLGSSFIARQNRVYHPFEDARKFVQKLKLKSGNEWRVYCKSGKKPDYIPTNPNLFYKDDGWISWGDWLGTGYIAGQNRNYRPFKDARDFVRRLQLSSTKDWSDYCKSGSKPADIPMQANQIYKTSGWISWGDWLGTGYIVGKKRKYLPFKQARAFVQKLKLNSRIEWTDYCRSGQKPDDIPTKPERVYVNDGWISMGDWLGTGFVAMRNRTYRPFRQARNFVQQLNLQSHIEWKNYCKSGRKPDDIPNYPNEVYKSDGWVGMRDWLGIKTDGI
ncbi:MAG: DEAD/DEAH box helicase family protein [Candidatus Obscuribacterales bacterium]|nr:DEAD/DEAH box helicase family protein [Candidatus Obscuribacterales bacterium]